MRFLTRVFGVTKDERYREAFLKGLRPYLQANIRPGLAAILSTGTAISSSHYFNDDAMVRLMDFLREVDGATYRFADDSLRKGAHDSFRLGRIASEMPGAGGGTSAVWCAQHDEIDYSPRPGRAYEFVSLSVRRALASSAC